MDAIDENHGDQQQSRLACQGCQRKKVKCDRQFPCSNCQKSSQKCIPSTRKQRARHAGKRIVDGELRNRIAKLESLVESLNGDVGIQSGTASNTDTDERRHSDSATSSPHAVCPDRSVDKYVASPFWSSLTAEMQGLRDALEEDDQDDESPDADQQAPPVNDMASMDFDLILCPPGMIYVMPGAMVEPTPEISQQLFSFFCRNVEPMMKIYHRPSLTAFMLQGCDYIGLTADAAPNKALKRVVWYAAVNTLTDEQCNTILGQNKEGSLQHFRRLAGISLTQADIVNTTSLATMQAYATYLAALRTTDKSRRVWTLLALLVRTARAIGLHHEYGKFTPYEQELRRRLWYQIQFLDIFCAVDRGTEIMIPQDSFTTILPTECNDADFDERSTYIQSKTGTGLTDMTYALICFHASSRLELLNRSEHRPSSETTWEKRYQLTLDYGKIIDERLLKYLDLNVPYHRFLYAVGRAMKAAMVLRAIRPMQRHVSSVPPRVDSQFVLQMAIEVMAASEALHTMPDGEGWMWFVWVQWHALSVSLAGLCSLRGTDQSNKAWYLVDQQYPRWSRHVADSAQGMLWKPIEKLYKKAAAFRAADPGFVAGNNTTISGANSVPQAVTNLDPFDFSSILGTQSQIPFQQASGAIYPDPMDSMNTMASGIGALSPFAVEDTSWLDWGQIVDDFADPNYMADLMHPTDGYYQ